MSRTLRACLLLFCLGLSSSALAEDWQRQLRNGLGFDFPLGSSGNLHLTLHERRNPEKVGLRIALAERTPAARDWISSGSWSLGPRLMLVRSDEGDQFLSLVPQLRAQFSLQGLTVHTRVDYGFWSADSGRTPLPERCWQAQFSARF